MYFTSFSDNCDGEPTTDVDLDGGNLVTEVATKDLSHVTRPTVRQQQSHSSGDGVVDLGVMASDPDEVLALTVKRQSKRSIIHG